MLIKAFPGHHFNDSEINKLLTSLRFRPHVSSDGATAPTAACPDRGTMLSSCFQTSHHNETATQSRQKYLKSQRLF
jgi:hypothetical protein